MDRPEQYEQLEAAFKDLWSSTCPEAEPRERLAFLYSMITIVAGEPIETACLAFAKMMSEAGRSNDVKCVVNLITREHIIAHGPTDLTGVTRPHDATMH